MGGMEDTHYHVAPDPSERFGPEQLELFRRVVKQIASLPAGRHDDAADACGLIGRALDQFPIVRENKPPPPKEELKPFTVPWLTYQAPQVPKVRYV